VTTPATDGLVAPPRVTEEVHTMSPTIPVPGPAVSPREAGRKREAATATERPARPSAAARDDEIFDRKTTVLLGILVAMMVGALALVAFKLIDEKSVVQTSSAPAAAVPAAAAGGGAQAHAAHAAHGAADTGKEEVEPFKAVDPTLPAIPAGEVKKFRVDVYEHVTKVSDDLPATRVWSYGINGKLHRGTGVSEPMVVTQGDEVEITLVNGADKSMNVQFPHSIDYHSSEIAPNKAFKTIGAGEKFTFSFEAKHAGVFMYHCATDPVLLHTGAGMVGMMIVKPRDLAPVDKELWITQQEYYLGQDEGDNADQGKMQAKQPDVIAFNGYAAQYKKHPIKVKKGEKVRMYVLNAGPSIWSAFHVIGTVFDRTVIEGTTGTSVQTVNLAPSQGGWVEFTLDDEGNFPFVTHAFGDMVKGAVGVLQTEGSTAKGMGH
jgi:nitrite reductase (NO-forming)